MFSNSQILPGLIVFEGLDGSGTTTQLSLLKDRLKDNGIPHHLTFEPSESAVGLLIRRILSGELNYTRKTLARLFAADREEHLFGAGGMLERSRAGELVICDRYILSSLAYQGNELGLETVWEYNKTFPLPEILIFLDVQPEDGHRRYSNRERLEIYEKLDLQSQIRQRYFGFFESVKKSGVDLYIIDSTREISEIAADIWRIISQHPISKG